MAEQEQVHAEEEIEEVNMRDLPDSQDVEEMNNHIINNLYLRIETPEFKTKLANYQKESQLLLYQLKQTFDMEQFNQMYNGYDHQHKQALIVTCFEELTNSTENELILLLDFICPEIDYYYHNPEYDLVDFFVLILKQKHNMESDIFDMYNFSGMLSIILGNHENKKPFENFLIVFRNNFLLRFMNLAYSLLQTLKEESAKPE